MTNIPVRRGTAKPATTSKKTTKQSDKTIGELADELENDEPLLPTYSKEDDILQDATKDLEEPFFEEESKKPKKHRSKKPLIVIAVLVLLGAIGTGGWYLVVKKQIFAKKNSPAASSADKAASPATTQPSVVLDLSPNTVAYAYRDSNTVPYTVYYRPAAGGDRTEVTKLPKDFSIAYHDAQRSSVAFASDSVVYVSSDAGKTYTKIYETTGGGAITSIKLSAEGDRLAVGMVPNFGSNVKGGVFSVDLQGKDKKDLFDADKYAIYVIGWSSAKQKMAYAEGCYGCDGSRSAYKMRDLKAKTASDLIPGGDIKTLGFAQSISDDMTKLIYVESTYDPAIKVDGPVEYYSAAPYKIKVLDYTTNKTTTVATVGTKNEKNANGTEKMRQFNAGFNAGSTKAYYTEGTSLYGVDGGSQSILYTAGQSILGVGYVGKDQLLTWYGKDASDFILVNYGLSGKKETKIFGGDNNTVVLGVTTK